MKTFILLILLFSMAHAKASLVPLPLGGSLKMVTSEWNVQETKAITGKNMLLFAHTELSNLYGTVMDGSVKEKGECQQEKSEICDRRIDLGKSISYQIIAQRFHGKNTYQNYIIAFTFDKSQENKFLPKLKDLKSKLEFAQ